MGKLKLNAKSFVAGMLLMALLTPLIAMASEVVTRQITYGVRVVVNGQPLQLDGIDRPFIMEGRTFLPVSIIARELGVAADWDGATSTVFIGDRHASHRTPLRHAASYFDKNPNADWNSWNGIWFYDTVTMSGVTYNNPLNFRRTGGGAATQFTLHNLNGQYRTFSGQMGRVDGSIMHNATVNIIGDGRNLQSFHLNATEMPTSFSVFVEGVQQLRIEVEFPADWSGSRRGNRVESAARYAIVGYLE